MDDGFSTICDSYTPDMLESLAVVSLDQLAHSYVLFLGLNLNRNITIRPIVCGNYLQT